MKASATLMGIVRIGTVAEGMCQRKRRMISATMTISSISLCETVEMARSMSSLRS